MTSGPITGYREGPAGAIVVGVTATERPPARPARRARTLLPGLLLTATGTAVAFAVHDLVPVVSALTAAVVLGVCTGRFLPRAARPGLSWATRTLLRLGVVLLGLQLGLGEVLGLGAGTVAAVVGTVLVAFLGTLAVGRWIGVSPGLTLMVATGFSVCGASAIAAMDSVTEGDREDVATGITLVTLYGSAAIALVPLLASWLGMGPAHLGAWAGLSVHEVAQVVAAASPAGAAAVATAVVIKLTRVLMLAPMVAAVSIVRRRRGTAPGTGRRPPLVPLFVLGFLAMMAVRSTGAVPAAVVSATTTVTTLLFAAALFGLGSAVRVGTLLRTGRRGLLLGAASTVLVGAVGLGALAVTGGP